MNPTNSTYRKFNNYFDSRKDIGVIFLRLVIGWRLVDGTQDNVFSWARMIEFRDFLAAQGVGTPLTAAIVSVYAQFICGICFIIGLSTRLAAAVMIVNFITAIVLVHLSDSFQQAFDAWMMLFGAVFFLFYGAGNYSADEILARKKGR